MAIRRLPVNQLQEISRSFKAGLIDEETAKNMFFDTFGEYPQEDEYGIPTYKEVKFAFRMKPGAFIKSKITPQFRSEYEDRDRWLFAEFDPNEIFYSTFVLEPQVREDTRRHSSSSSSWSNDNGWSSEAAWADDPSWADEPGFDEESSSSAAAYEEKEESDGNSFGLFLLTSSNIFSLEDGHEIVEPEYSHSITIEIDPEWLTELEGEGDDRYMGVSRRARYRSPMTRRISPIRSIYRSPVRGLRRSPIRMSPVRGLRRSPIRMSPVRGLRLSPIRRSPRYALRR
jgi:hypothetical protein